GYCADNGRPNASIRVLVGVLVLQAVFNLPDADALDAAEYDLRWQTALGLGVDDPVPCQKTLHNFRGLLAQRVQPDDPASPDRVEQLFTTLTDRLLVHLGVQHERQRLDSTQICSNIALLSRLSRFCETHRLLLHRLARYAPATLARLPEAVQRRYVRADGSDASYDAARATEGRRRLAVCARDAWRLVDALRGVALPAPVQEAYGLVERLLREHCLVLDAPATPQAEDADVAEPAVPVRLRDKGEVAAGGLQTPHDPDATYGHKGTGYTVTLCETMGNGDTPELLTHIVLTTACAADQLQTLPTMDALTARGLHPQELAADSAFGSTEALLACQTRGTTLVAPVTGGAPTPSATPTLRVACLPGAPPSACSLGMLADSTVTRQQRDHLWYEVRFTAAACAGCPQAACCPARVYADGSRRWRVLERDAVNTLRRWLETQPAFKDRYRWRSGIEATNSECKRAHGLGRLRVRGWTRVRVAVFLAGLACNVKRALQHWQRQATHTARAAAANGLPGRRSARTGLRIRHLTRGPAQCTRAWEIRPQPAAIAA
ncbi:MAG TPA: transposase, partial [Armatimonadota bacterium]